MLLPMLGIGGPEQPGTRLFLSARAIGSSSEHRGLRRLPVAAETDSETDTDAETDRDGAPMMRGPPPQPPPRRVSL